MPVLWNPTWTVAPDFRVWRSRVKGFVIGWHSGHFVQTGRDTVIREIPFGGYRTRITFKPEFWQANNKEWRLEGIFENAYFMAPADNTPIAISSLEINFNWQPLCRGYALIIALPSLGRTWYWQRYPPITYGYWARNDLPWEQEPPFINT